MRKQLLGGAALASILVTAASAEILDLETVRSEISQKDGQQTAFVDQTRAKGALSIIDQSGSENFATIDQEDGASSPSTPTNLSYVEQTGSKNSATVTQSTDESDALSNESWILQAGETSDVFVDQKGGRRIELEWNIFDIS